MRRNYGSDWVKAGYYFSPSQWKIATIAREGGELPGEVGVRYIRIPVPLLMIAAPIMGALYVVVLPVIGIGAILWLGSERVLARVRAGRTQTVAQGKEV